MYELSPRSTFELGQCLCEQATLRGANEALAVHEFVCKVRPLLRVVSDVNVVVVVRTFGQNRRGRFLSNLETCRQRPEQRWRAIEQAIHHRQNVRARHADVFCASLGCEILFAAPIAVDPGAGKLVTNRCRFPFNLSLLIFQLALLVLSICHQACRAF